MFLDKLENSIYNKRLAPAAKTLRNGEEDFKNLSTENQCRLLAEALKLFQCNVVLSDLSLIGGPKMAGSIRPSKVISTFSTAILINQSVTGLFEEEIDLLNS